MIIDNDYKPEDDLELEDSIRIQKRGVKDIFEDEISEPEIMIFCKGDHKSTELLSLYAKMAKLHEYDQIINHEARFEENTETDVKSNFVRNFYLVNYN
jgi:hypothetical protein